MPIQHPTHWQCQRRLVDTMGKEAAVQGAGWIAPNWEEVRGTGWIAPDQRHLASAHRILLVGLVVAPVLAFVTMAVIANAWASCGDAEPPYLFSLLFGFLPLMSIVTWFVWAIGPGVAARGRAIVMFLAALVLAVLVNWGAIADQVPMNEPSYYADATAPGHETPGFDPSACRLDGVPKWWPSWLPI